MSITHINKRGIMSNLYDRDLYLNHEYEYLINRKIVEYDMKSAGYNLSVYYKLLPKQTLDNLAKLEKHERHIEIGKLQRFDKEYAKKLSKAFKSMRKEFFIANRIVDSDILSIKKDAIFIVGKKCNNLEFENVTFVEKNVYSSFHYLNNLEFYYSSSKNILDVKGINDDSLCQFTFFINILKKLFKLLEANKREEFIKLIKKFTEDYKNKNLIYEYYKEFRPDGSFALIQKNEKSLCISLDGMDETVHDLMDISYNYIHYILPIIQRHYFK